MTNLHDDITYEERARGKTLEAVQRECMGNSKQMLRRFRSSEFEQP